MSKNERYRLVSAADPCAGRLKVDKLGNLQVTMDGQAVFDMLWKASYRHSGAKEVDGPCGPDRPLALVIPMPRQRTRDT